MVAVTVEGLGHQSLQGFPNELYRIVLRGIWRKEHQMDVQGFCLRQDLLGMMNSAIIGHHNDREVIVPPSHGLQEHAHVLRLRMLWELYDGIAPDGVESHGVRFDPIRVLHHTGLIRTPFANSVRNGLRGGFILETEDEITGIQTVQSNLESFFKTVSASAGRRWSIGYGFE